MDGFLKKATASQTRILGPFIDDTDFKSAATGLSILNTNVKLMKNGAASVNKNSGGGIHRVNGDYAFTFDATDTDTVGELEVSVAVSGALVVKRTYTVIDDKIYDALYSSTPTLLTSLDIGQFYEGDITTVNSQVSFDMGVPIITDDNWIGNIVSVHDVSTGDAVTRYVVDVDQTNDRIIIDSAPTFTVVTGDLLRVESRVHPLYAQTLLNDVTPAQVNAEVDTALQDIHLDHLFAAEYDPASKPGVATALMNELIENDGGISRFSANTLEQAPVTTTAGFWEEVLGSTNMSASALIQIIAGVCAGKLTGADTTTLTFRNIEDTGNLLVVTTDANGNRSAITITVPPN